MYDCSGWCVCMFVSVGRIFSTLNGHAFVWFLSVCGLCEYTCGSCSLSFVWVCMKKDEFCRHRDSELMLRDK